ncbi:MAG: response regulator transcription factor [Nocardioidaceae bacterium]
MRVLVVDDEPRLAETVRLGLVAEGFAVDVVHNGTDAIWAATERPYDVIILDIMLPGIDGVEVLQRLRADEIWTPILMLTAKDRPHDLASALGDGADDYLAKPFDFVVLVARLRGLVRRIPLARRPVLTAGDLACDSARRLVSRGKIDIDLTPREFGVLEFLMRHCGDVVSKTQIMQNVWDEHYDGDPNIVEVYIRYLRVKIDLPFGREAIQTVRGVGYRLARDGG